MKNAKRFFRIYIWIFRVLASSFMFFWGSIAAIGTIFEGRYIVAFLSVIGAILCIVLIWVLTHFLFARNVFDMEIFDEYVEFTLLNEKKIRINKTDICKISFADGTYEFYLTNREVFYFAIENPTVAVFGDGKKRLKEINEYNFPYSKLNV